MPMCGMVELLCDLSAKLKHTKSPEGNLSIGTKIKWQKFSSLAISLLVTHYSIY